MNYMRDNADWIVPSVIAALALAFAIWSAVSAHVSKKEARRSADAAEQQVEIQRTDREESAEALRQRPWEVRHEPDSKYRVTNRGGTAYDVDVGGQARVIAGARGLGVIKTGEYFVLLSTQSFNGEGDIELSWAESEGGPRRTQHELLL